MEQKPQAKKEIDNPDIKTILSVPRVSRVLFSQAQEMKNAQQPNDEVGFDIFYKEGKSLQILRYKIGETSAHEKLHMRKARLDNLGYNVILSLHFHPRRFSRYSPGELMPSFTDLSTEDVNEGPIAAIAQEQLDSSIKVLFIKGSEQVVQRKLDYRIQSRLLAMKTNNTEEEVLQFLKSFGIDAEFLTILPSDKKKGSPRT